MPPTLLDLREGLARDLRDEQMKTFKQPYLDDLINAGIEEVSRLYPKETIATITPAPGTYAYAMLNVETIFRVEVWQDSHLMGLIPESDGVDPASGWEVFVGSLHLPAGVIDSAAPTSTLKAWGYAKRAQLENDADVSDLDSTAEWGVRRYGRAQGFALMQNDRALFKQWQGASQNSDVSPNMLNQMVSLYQSEWDRNRNYLRRLRRI